MPLITVDQDRLDVAHFDNGSNWNQRMYRSLASTIQRTTTTNNSNTDTATQLQRSESYVLAHLNTTEEEDMSVMTIDTAFRTSSINNSNLVDTMNMSGGGGGGNSFMQRSPRLTSCGSNMSIMSISEESPQNHPQIGGQNAQFNLTRRQPPQQQQQQEHQEHHSQHRRQTMNTANTSKSSATRNNIQPSRYSTQTYSNRSTIRSSIHSSAHSNSNNTSSHHSNTNNNTSSGYSSSGSTSHHSISGSVVSVNNGSSGSLQQQRRRNRQLKHQDKQNSLSYNSTRSRSKAVAIYPQPKTRRRRTTLPVDLDTSSSTGDGSRLKEDDGEGGTTTTAARERRRTTLGEELNTSMSSSLTPSLATPSSKTPRAVGGGRRSGLEHTPSSKTLTTSNHSYPTVTSSITTPGDGAATAITPPSPNEYNARIEGEIVHLSYELATTKTNLDQANMLIRDYKRQAVKFQSLVDRLQDEISGLKTKLVAGDNKGTYIRSDISTVEEGTGSMDEFIGSSNGSSGATQIAGEQRSLTTTVTTQQQQNIMTDDSDAVSNDDDTSTTAPTTSALEDKTIASHHNNIVAIAVGTSSRTTTAKHDNHNHHNEQPNNHLRVSPDLASTIRRPSYTSDEIDAMVEVAAVVRRRQSMDVTLSSIGEGENTNCTSPADTQENCLCSTNTTSSSTGAHRSAAQAGDKRAGVRRQQQQQQTPHDHSHPSLQSNGDQAIAEDIQGRKNQRRDSGTSTTASSRTRSKSTKKDISVSGETSAETTNTTSRGGDVGSDSEIFTGDPFATVNGHNDDEHEILDQIASVLNYDLVKPVKVDNDKCDMLAPHNSDFTSEYKLAVSSVWTSLFRRPEQSDAHSKQGYQQPVKKRGMFGF